MGSRDRASEVVPTFEALERRLMLNTAPVATAKQLSIDEDTTVDSFVVGTDSDDDFLTFLVTDQPDHGGLAFTDWGLFTYTPEPNYTGSDTFQFKASDGLDESGAATVTITINGVNDVPVNSVPAVQSTDEDTALVFSTGNGNLISISDVDAGTNAMQVTLTGANGTMTLAGTTGLTFSVGDGTDDATMTFTGTISNINTALDGLSFAPTEDYNGSGASVQIQTSDQGNTGSGGAQSDDDTVNITVSAVNDAPELANVGSGSVAYTENDAATAITSTLTVSDDDGDDIASATVQITTGYVQGEDVLTFVDTGSITGTWDPENGKLTLSGTDTTSNYEAALRAVKYENLSDDPSTADRTIEFKASDGQDESSAATRTIDLTSVNDAPVISIPNAQTAYKNATLTFSADNGNLISIADPDAQSGTIEVSLSASYGTITLGSTTGITITAGSNPGSSMTFEGTLTNVSNALKDMTYKTSSSETQDTLQISVDDKDNTGDQGGNKTDSENLTINIEDNPIQVGGPTEVNEGASYTVYFAPKFDETVNTWDIDWGDTSSDTGLSGSLRQYSHTYADDAENVTITVTANTGGSPAPYVEYEIDVLNVRPALILSGPEEVEQGETYTLTLNSEDPGNDTITDWRIDWGDGSSSTEFQGGAGPHQKDHTYSPDGPKNYTIKVQVKDDDSDSTWYADTVLVAPVTYFGWRFHESESTSGSNGATAVLDQCVLTLTEGDSFYSALSRKVTVPSSPSTLDFRYEEYDLDDTATAEWINDALEVSFLDDIDGSSLVPTVGWGLDSYYNVYEDSPNDVIEMATGASESNNLISVNISDLQAGTTGRLFVKLINNDSDTGSYVEIPVLAPSISGSSSVNEGSAYTLTLEIDGPGVAGMTGRKFIVVDNETAEDIYRYDSGGTLLDHKDVQSGNDAPRGAAYHEYAGATDNLLWVVDSDGNVYVYDYSTGDEGGTKGYWTAQYQSTTLSDPQGITTDGTDIWIVDGTADKVYFYDGGASWWDSSTHNASTVSTETWALDTDNDNPTGIAFGKLSKELCYGQITSAGTYSQQDNDTELTDSSGPFTQGMVGAKITLSSSGKFTIKTWLSATQIKVTGDASGSADEHHVVVGRDDYLWVTDNTDDMVYVYTTEGDLAGGWYLDSDNADPSGIAIDPDSVSQYASGEDVWVVDSADSKIYKYAGGATWTYGGREADASVSLNASNDNAAGVAAIPGEWRIDWGDDTPVQSVNTDLSSITHYYADDDLGSPTISADLVYGVYDRTLEADDVTVAVANAAPTLEADYGFSAYDDSGWKLEVQFSGAFTDPGFTLGGTSASETFTVTIDWDGPGPGQPEEIGDVTVLNGSAGVNTYAYFEASHDYTTFGDYTATVKIEDDDGGIAGGQDGVSYYFSVVEIDVKSTLNLKSNGIISVDVLWSEGSWNPDDKMDVTTVRFGPAGAKDRDQAWGGPDRVQFQTAETGIAPADQVAFLTGNFISGYKGGRQFIGMDTITIASGSEHGKNGVPETTRKWLVIDSTIVGDDSDLNTVFGYESDGDESGNVTYLTMRDPSDNVISTPTGIAARSDGDYVWTLDISKTGASVAIDPYVTVWEHTSSPSIPGDSVGSWQPGGVITPTGITTDDTDIWIVDAEATKLRVMRYVGAASRTYGFQPGVVAFELHEDNTAPTDIVTDGDYFYVSENNGAGVNDEVFVYDTAGGLVDRWQLAPGSNENRDVTGITLDASSSTSNTIWTVDIADDKIYAYTNGRERGTIGRQLNDNDSPILLATGNINPQGIADPPTVMIDEVDALQLAWDNVLISGRVDPDGSTKDPITQVTINDEPVDVLDAGGNFFTVVALGTGAQDFELEATDAGSATDSETITLTPLDLGPGEVDWSRMSDVTAGFDATYKRTSFSDADNLLHVDVKLDEAENGSTRIYTMYSPILVGVRNIDRPNVSLHDPDGVTADGVAYYEVYQVTVDSGGAITGIPSVELVFHNPDRVQFSYELVILARNNRPPVFTSLPVVEVVAGQTYEYAVEAVDPEGEAVDYTLQYKPGDMDFDEDDETLIEWSTGSGDVGNHVIVVRAEDPAGAYSEQAFVLSVISTPTNNRPPEFTSTPIVDGYVNRPYEYQATAEDPDGDDLIFSGYIDPDYGTFSPRDSFTLASANDDPTGITSDGSLVWVTDDTDDAVYVYDTSGNLKGSWSLASANDTPAGIAVDGDDLWVLDSADDKVYQYQDAVSATDGSETADAEFTLDGGNTSPTGISTDGSTLWVTDDSGSGGEVFAYDLNSTPTIGALLGSFETYARNPNPLGVANNAAGDKLWVLDSSEILAVYDYGTGDEGDVLGRWAASGIGTAVAVAASGGKTWVLSDETTSYSVITYEGWAPLSLDFNVDANCLVTWTPPAEFVDQLVDVYLHVKDDVTPSSSSLSDTQEFSIYVHPEPFNNPPEIISEPIETHYVPDASNEPVGSVSHQAIDLNLEPGEAITFSAGNAIWLDFSDVDSGWTPEGGVANEFAVENVWIDLDDPAYDVDDVEDLIKALTGTSGSGLVVTGWEVNGWSYSTDDVSGAGIFINDAASSYDAYELPDYGIVLSTGNAEDYGKSTDTIEDFTTMHGPPVPNYWGGGVSATGNQEAILDPITSGEAGVDMYDHYDCVELTVNFDLMPGFDGVHFDIVFGSEEYEEYVNSVFIDGFGLFVDGENIATLNGTPVNINHTWMKEPPDLTGDDYHDKTELDGILFDGPDPESDNPLVSFSKELEEGSLGHSLKFIIADTSDPILDSTVYIASLGGFQSSDIDVYLVPSGNGAEVFTPTPSYVTVDPGEKASFTGTFEYPDPGTHVDKQGIAYAFDLEFQNEGGTIVYGSIPVTVNTDYFYLVKAVDPDGDPLTYALLDGTDVPLDSIDPNTGAISWRPTEAGSYDFNIEVTDGRGGRDEQSYTLTVYTSGAGNNAPSISSIPTLNAVEGRQFSYAVEATDPDGEQPQFYLTKNSSSEDPPAGLSIDRATGELTWIPTTSQVGNHTVRVVAADGRGKNDTEEFTISVASASSTNNNPTIESIPTILATPAERLQYEVEATDADNDHLRYRLATKPDGMGIDQDTGVLTWAPTMADVGTHSVIVRVTDGQGGSALEPFQVVVRFPNDPPVFTSEPITQAGVGMLYQYQPTAEDPNGDVVSFALDPDLDYMSLGPDQNGDWWLQWVPTSGQTGEHWVELAAVDERGGVSYQGFPLTVSDNAPPDFTSEPTYTVTVDTEWSYTPTVVDPDDDVVRLELDQDSIGRGMTLSSGQITWTPSDTGQYEVSITAWDPLGAGMTQTFTLYVTPVLIPNEPVEITSVPHGPAYEGDLYEYKLTGEDPESGTLTWGQDTSVYSGVPGLSVQLVGNDYYYKGTPSQGTGGNTYTVVLYVYAGTETDYKTYQQFDLPVASTAPGNHWPEITSVPRGPAYMGVEWEYVVEAYDIDDDTLQYSIVSVTPSNPGLSFSDNVLSWTPDSPDTEPYYTVTIRVSDGTASFDQVFDLPLEQTAPGGSAPVITSEPTGPAYEGETWTYQVYAYDPDYDGLAFALNESKTEPTSVSVGSNGLVTWTPGENDGGVSTPLYHTIAVDVGDGTNTTTQIFDLPVFERSNRDPVITSVPPMTAYVGEPYTYQVSAHDPDGDELRYSLEVAPAGMGIDEFTGLIEWLPSSALYEDPADEITVKVRVTDSRGGYDTQDFTYVFESERLVDVAPEFTSEPLGPAVRGLAYEYPAQAVDPNGDPVDYALGEHPTGMSIDSSTGVVTWTPSESQVGCFLVEVIADDEPQGTGNSTTQSFVLPVVENLPPVFELEALPPATVNVDYTHEFAATDANGDAILFSLAAGTPGQINATSGVFQWTPPTAGSYPYTVTINVVADDQHGGVVTQPFLIQVNENATNDAPSFDQQWSPRDKVQPGQVYYARALASDPDGDELEFSLETRPDGMAIDSATGMIRWEVPADATLDSTASFRVGVTDNIIATPVLWPNSGNFDITIVDYLINEPPEITTVVPGTGATVGYEYAYDADATDADGDPLTWLLLVKPDGMEVDVNTGEVTWTPTEGQAGLYHEVQLGVTDFIVTAVQQFFVPVHGGNVPPRIDSTPVTDVLVNGDYVYPVVVSDPDGGTLQFSVSSDAPNLDNDSIDDHGVITWTAPGSPATYPVTITVTDGRGGQDTQTFQLAVSNQNVPPQISSVPGFYAMEDVQYEYQIIASDPNGDNLTYDVESSPASSLDNVTIPSTGLLQWTPGLTESATYTVTITVSDGTASRLQIYTLDVADSSNGAPSFVNDLGNQTATVGVPFSLAAPATDPDGDWILYSLSGQPQGMEIDLFGRITWVPASGGPHNITVDAADVYGNEAQSDSFQLTVQADTEKPQVGLEIHPDWENLYVGMHVTFRVTASDNVGVTDLTLTFNGTALPISPDGYASKILSEAGPFTATATAKDASNNTSDPVSITRYVITEPSSAPPLATIISPESETEVSAAVDVIGSIDLNGSQNDVYYKLQITPTSTIEWIDVTPEPINIGHSQNVTTEVLGQIDGTSLPNGSYYVRILAWNDAYERSSEGVLITINSALKLGNFSLSFTDLSVPVGGIPITFERKYDTLRADTPGDFGYGWQADMLTMRAVVDFIPVESEWEWYYGTDPGWYSGVRVYVEMPDGSTEGFTLSPEPNDWFGLTWQVAFLPDMGVASTLELESSPSRVYVGPLFVDYDGCLREHGSDRPLNPEVLGLDFALTTLEGTVYRFSGTSGELQSMTDRSGNHLVVSGDGVTSYTADGEVAAQVGIQRGPHGITQITDPMGYKITYEYDSNGDLVKITDRVGNTKEGSERDPYEIGLVYGAEQDHYLTKIVRNPDGDPVTIVEVQFDPNTGRVTGFKDAAGNVADVDYQIEVSSGEHVERVEDANGVPTEVVRDDDGNVVRRILHRPKWTDAGNPDEVTYQITVSEYEGGNLKRRSVPFEKKEGDLAGETRFTYLPEPENMTWQETYAYNPDGTVESVTDAEDGTTHYSYSSGYLWQITDPLGNITQNHYDLDTGDLKEVWQQVGTDGSGNPVFSKARYSYANGKLTQVIQVDESGREIVTSSSTYDFAGRVATSTNASGVTQHFVHDANGNLIISYRYWEDPNDGDAEIDNTIADRSVRDAEGRVTSAEQYVYNTSKTFTADYDFSGDGAQKLWSTSTVYNGAGQVESTTDRYGTKTTSTYNSRGGLVETYTEAKDDQGTDVFIVTRTVYDDNGRATYTSDPHQESIQADKPVPAESWGTQTIYDGMGRTILTERLSGLKIALDTSNDAYVVENYEGTVKSSTGTTYTAEGRVEVVTYDNDGNPATTDDDYTVTYTYGNAGRRESVTTDRDGDTGTTNDRYADLYGYDAAGRQTSVTQDRDGDDQTKTDQTTTSYEYDAAGRLVKVVYPDPDGTGPLGESETTVEYDLLGRTVAETDQMGETTGYEYDDAGRLTAVILPEISHPDTQTAGHPRHEYEYDVYGNQTLIRDSVFQVSSTGQVLYDHDGQTGDDDRETKFYYDHLNRRTKRELPEGVNTGTPTDDFVEQFFYDDGSKDGQLDYAIDFEDRYTEYEYDAFGRLEKKYYYEDSTSWDNGNGTPDEGVKYTYDALGRVVEVEQDADADFDQGEYDRHITEYTYDGEGRITKVETTMSGSSSPAYTLNYEYDEGTGLLTRTYTGTTGDRKSDVGYAYDTLGRLETVTVYERDGGEVSPNEVNTYGYDALGNLDWLELDNGVIADYHYDDLSRLVALFHFRNDSDADHEYDPGTSEVLLESYEYTLQADGKRTKVVEKDSSSNTITIEWSYDALGRLIEEDYDDHDSTPGDYVSTYTLDIVGNRVKKTAGNEVVEYYYDDNDRLIDEDLKVSSVLTQHTDHEYGTSDARTVLTKKTVTNMVPEPDETLQVDTYTYNCQGRLETVTVDGYTSGTLSKSERFTYTYDDHGIRVQQEYREDTDLDQDWEEETFTDTDYVIDASNHTGYGQVLEEWDPSGTPDMDKSYVIGQDVIAQWDETNGVLYLLADGHGSTRVLVDDADPPAIQQTFDYDAYGNIVQVQGPASPLTTLLYTREQFNETTNQYYLRARYYDPATGRFNRLDPAAGNSDDPISLHKYLYAGANPVMYTDPTGMFSLGELNVTSLISGFLRAIGTVARATAFKVAVNAIVSAFVGYDFATGIAAAEDAAPDCFAFGIGRTFQLGRRYHVGVTPALEVAIGLETGNGALFGAFAGTTGGSGWGPYFGFSWNTPNTRDYKGWFRSVTITLGRLPERFKAFVKKKVRAFLPRLRTAFAQRNGPIGDMARSVSPEFAGLLSGALTRLTSVAVDANWSVTLWGGFGWTSQKFSDSFGFTINLDQSSSSVVGGILGRWSVSVGRYGKILPWGRHVDF